MTNEDEIHAARMKVDQALTIIEGVGIPVAGRTKTRKLRLGMTLLALANLKVNDAWSQARYWQGAGSWMLTTREILKFWNEHYSSLLPKPYAPGSYDDVKRKELDYLIPSGLVLDGLTKTGEIATSQHDSTRRYAIAPDAASLLTTFDTDEWEGHVYSFVGVTGDFAAKLHGKQLAPNISGSPPTAFAALSDGEHNQLQRAIGQDFVPRFISKDWIECRLLYLADGAKKVVIREGQRLAELGLASLEQRTLPDVVIEDLARRWLYFFEAVHTSNPITKLRLLQLRSITEQCTLPIVYVTAFASAAKFKKYAGDIGWETHVWLAEEPAHVIHFNGIRFLGPYDPR